VETKAHLFFFLERVGGGGAVGVYIEPRGRWTEKVWEPLVYLYQPSMQVSEHRTIANALKVTINLKSLFLGTARNLNPNVIEEINRK
jgi:hypothetical protein